MREKHAPRKKSKRSSNCLPASVETETGAADNRGIWGEVVPPELLLKIFEHVVDSSGALPFVCR